MFRKVHFDGLVKNCSNSIANTLELLQSCTKPSIKQYVEFCAPDDRKHSVLQKQHAQYAKAICFCYVNLRQTSFKKLLRKISRDLVKYAEKIIHVNS